MSADRDDADEITPDGEPSPGEPSPGERNALAPGGDERHRREAGEGEPTPSGGDERQRRESGARARSTRFAPFLWAAVVITAVGWGVAAWWLTGWPERELEAAASEVESGALGQGVATLCATDPGRARLLELWQAAEPRRQDLIARAMLNVDCLDLLPDEARDAFDLRHAAWRLDHLAGDAGSELVEVLLVAPDALSRRRAAEALVALGPEGLAGLTDEQRAQILVVATLHTQQPWAIALLDALDSPQATAQLLAWYQLEHARGEASVPARLQRLTALVHAHWAQLPEAVRARWVGQWLDAGWRLRKNASVSQVQPVMVEATWAPPQLHGPLAGAVARVQAIELSIDGEPGRLGDEPIAARIGGHVFEYPGSWHRSVDITEVIDKHGRWQLGGTVEVALLPAEAASVDPAELAGPDGRLAAPWRERALFIEDRVVEPFTYRVYLNPELGLPKRIQDEAVRDDVVDHVDIALELSGGEDGVTQRTVLHASGKRGTEARGGLTHRHGQRASLVLEATDDPGIDLSLRVQARTKEMPAGEWRDLGQGIVRRDDLWPPLAPVRIDLDLAPVCPAPGPCRIALRVRDSLQVARPDARVEAYWGHVLELGIVELELGNAADGHHWPAIQQAVVDELDK